MMVMGDGPPKERGKHRAKVENEMIRRREREFRHQQMWAGAQDYYKRWDKINHKFDDWTSPRYYEDNNKLISEIRTKKDKEELLEKRREKLRKLLEEEETSHQIEVMVKKNLDIREKPAKSTCDSIPTEVLKEVNNEIRIKEEEKRRREAELRLYHQWRNNNPIVRQFESKYRFKDLKLSWLDQQIEKRMQKENEEKECKRLLMEQEARVKREKEKEDELRRDTEEKKVKLRENLDKQIEELKEKQKITEDLKRKEADELRYKLHIDELEKKSQEEEKRRQAKECALFNIRQHKLKLKQKALDVQENLAKEREFILTLKKLELEDLIEDQRKKNEIKSGLAEFLSIVKAQEELEKRRQKHLEFIFDSESKAVYNKQLELWNNEETLRKKLLNEVLDTVKKQVEDNLERNKTKQREILQEREEMAMKVEDYDRELRELTEQEEKRKQQLKKSREEEIKLKNARKKHEEHLKLKEIDEELERVRKEEERLSKEIMDIQRKQGPIRPRRGNGLF